jgi:hypothetical protein
MPEKKFIHDMGMQVFDMRYIDEYGMRNVMSSRWQAWMLTRICTSALTWIASTLASLRVWVLRYWEA